MPLIHLVVSTKLARLRFLQSGISTTQFLCFCLFLLYRSLTFVRLHFLLSLIHLVSACMSFIKSFHLLKVCLQRRIVKFTVSCYYFKITFRELVRNVAMALEFRQIIYFFEINLNLLCQAIM